MVYELQGNIFCILHNKEVLTFYILMSPFEQVRCQMLDCQMLDCQMLDYV